MSVASGPLFVSIRGQLILKTISINQLNKPKKLNKLNKLNKPKPPIKPNSLDLVIFYLAIPDQDESPGIVHYHFIVG